MWISLIIDVVIVAIVVVSALISAKRGFVRTMVELVGFIAAFLIASAVSQPLADITYDRFIGPSIVSKVTEATNNANEEISAEILDENASVLSEIWDSLPDIIKNNSGEFGIDKDALEETIRSYTTIETGEYAQKVSDDITKPIIGKLLSAVYSIIIFVVVSLIVKLLAPLANKVFSVSIVGKVNTILGGVIGAMKGCVTVFIICVIISVLVAFTNDGFGVFTPENISKTFLFKIFYGFSPFI
ncbi:MAG: CvpA family protein [Clostridia bacterium]|nr:CvpA family protein [Clostridia bacterium]